MTLLETLGLAFVLTVTALSLIMVRLAVINREVKPDKPIQKKQWRKTG